ncbi:hypothetical protein GCM10023225_05470 [Kineococcus glutinatus]|uniref:DUF4288 domain-containing protein n=2 Tax=Kineococcus glutinatus TaxID=1070872 RepID=A0ABP9H9Y2_9ACTN
MGDAGPAHLAVAVRTAAGRRRARLSGPRRAGRDLPVHRRGGTWQRFPMTNSGWVAVRCVFRTRFGDQQVYEERITLWHEQDMDRAIELAEAEAVRYAARTSAEAGSQGGDDEAPTEYLGMAQAYLLDDEPGHGAEVFSLMRTSGLDPMRYLDTFFDTGAERVGAVEEG